MTEYVVVVKHGSGDELTWVSTHLIEAESPESAGEQAV